MDSVNNIEKINFKYIFFKLNLLESDSCLLPQQGSDNV